MKIIDTNKWDRKQHFEHFMNLRDPYFGVTIPVDVNRALAFSKAHKTSFFAKYLHDCMLAINAVENLRYRIVDGQVVEYEVIHASSTIMRTNNTFGFSHIPFNKSLKIFTDSYLSEKIRIENSADLFPPISGLDCIYCSVLPWFSFSGHKEAVSGEHESVPKIAFSKTYADGERLFMNVAINVNHALVDGYHLGLFAEIYQQNLDKP